MKVDNRYVLARAKKIANSLLPLSDGDRLWVLYTAINHIAGNGGKKGQARTAEVQIANVNLVPRSRGSIPKIQKDYELRNFIHQYPVLLSAEKLQQVLVDSFGQKRAPSVNTLRKYLKQMAQTTGRDIKGA